MSICRKDEIAAVLDSGKVICSECYSGDYNALNRKDIIMDADVSDSDVLYFCDECEKQL